MFKKFILILFLQTAVCAMAQLQTSGIKVDPSATRGVTFDWPEIDADGEDITSQALVVIEYEHLLPEVIQQFKFEITDIVPNGIRSVKNERGEDITLIFLPLKAKDKYLKVVPRTFTGVITPIPAMQDRGVYSMKVSDTRRVDIQVSPMVDDPATQVWLDDVRHFTVPATFTDVTLGTHKLTFTGAGIAPVERTINVTMQDTKFSGVTNADFDLRKRVPLTITSDVSNSSLYVDGEKVADRAPYTLTLPAGEYTIKAVNNDAPQNIDRKTVKLLVDGPFPKVHLRPRYNVTFNVTALLKHQSVPFELYVNGKENQEIEGGDNQVGLNPEYAFTLPVGEKCRFKATYGSYQGSKKITVKQGMARDVAIDLKRRRQFVWPWDREYDEAPLGLEVAWVRKQFRVSADGEEIYRGKMVFVSTGEGEDKWLNGVRAGVHFQPTFFKGLGIYTGLFWECYLASTDQFKTPGGYTTDFSKYEEHNLYLPLHLFYEIPLARKVAIGLHGGVGLNYCLARKYYDYKLTQDGIDYNLSYNLLKDTDEYFPEFPDSFSASWEVGLQLRLGPVIIGAEILNPITKHKFTVDGIPCETTTHRQALTLSYVFNGSAFH